jgi:hypothetical protein
MSYDDNSQKKSSKKDDKKPVDDITQSYEKPIDDITQSYGKFTDYEKTPDKTAESSLKYLLENWKDTDIAEAIREYLPTLFTVVETTSKDKISHLLGGIVDLVGIESFKKAVNENTTLLNALKEIPFPIVADEFVWAGSDVSSVSYVYIKAPVSLSTEKDKTTTIIRIQGVGNMQILAKGTNVPKAQFDVKRGDIVTIKDGKEVSVIIKAIPLPQYHTTFPDELPSQQYKATNSNKPKITQSY